MARNLRDLRRKMKSIKSTCQVTKAMELVAASKMRRAVSSAQQLRAYATKAAGILERIAEVHPDLHPYLAERTPAKILGILLTPDRGLCGSLNTQLFRTTLEEVKRLRSLASFERIEFVASGRKGQQFLRRMDEHVLAAFPAMSNHPTVRDILPIARLATEHFLAGNCDHVLLFYTNFRSALKQEPTVTVLLPFSRGELKKMLVSLSHRRQSDREHDVSDAGKEAAVLEYLFEPSQEEVLRVILPQLTEAQVYQAILEATASEHSARMVAMHSATENATDILEDLTLTYNQTRQASITAELAELSATKAVLK